MNLQLFVCKGTQLVCPSAAAIAVLAFLIAAAPASAQLPITVGPTVHVSTARAALDHYEMEVNADLSNADRLIGCTMYLPSTKGTFNGAVYVSHDGGKTWRSTLDVEKGWTGDPSCVFGLDGTAYAVFLGEEEPPPGTVRDPAARNNRMFVYRSSDGGLTWQPPTVLPFIDREWVRIDASDGPRRGHVYINGTGSTRLMDGTRISNLTVFRSTDAGKTFDYPASLTVQPPRHVLGMGNSVVLSDGTLVVLFGEQRDLAVIGEPISGRANSTLKIATSTDGATLAVPVTVSDWYMNYGDIIGTSSVMPSLAVDATKGPFRDRLYVVWPDYRSGRGEVFFAWSSDKGKTWSAPAVINDEPATASPERPSHDLPMVAVNKDGVVGISWYDRRDNPGDIGWRVRFTASLDGGRTWMPSVKVSDAAPGYDRAPTLSLESVGFGGGSPRSMPGGAGQLRTSIGPGYFYFSGGHTTGLAADAGGAFHPFWSDNRTGIFQLYTSRVTVAGRVTKHGATELDALTDVTGDVDVALTNVRYVRATNSITADATLVNTSKRTLRAPFKVRLLSATSKRGSVEVVNADNRLAGPGAIWEFRTTGAVELKPGDRSAVRPIEFRLSGVLPLLPPQRRFEGTAWLTITTASFAAAAEGPAEGKR